MGTIGIKAFPSTFNPQIAMVMRKYVEISIRDVKKIVDSNDYLYKCDVLDDHGIETILLINADLRSQGISSALYEDNETTTTENLKNILSFYSEIDDQVEGEMDAEVLSNEGEL